ncbi:winged helix-turn-helix transcriptional regulator [Cetobacterium somerae]|uniref:winged helix-turn-helix transcriptional regulator n=1 Tax=Cetobacterium somerae TaxID=188913 RepID=UPI001F052BE9|nr:winged helix-turn-helix transcriptional regulator [Cetobacterium somerae]UPO97467.1 winged helix-turn-helix transcriptional regulator [Cetobacterium somerae]
MKLSKGNMKLLKFINENPGVTQLEIAQEIGISKGSISIFVKKAKENNYILEIKKEQKVKIHPTKLGKDIVMENTLKNLAGIC